MRHLERTKAPRISWEEARNTSFGGAGRNASRGVGVHFESVLGSHQHGDMETRRHGDMETAVLELCLALGWKLME